MSVSLEQRCSVVATVEIADERTGVAINITEVSWRNAAMKARILGPVKEAMKATEVDNLGLAQVPCIVTVLNAHVEAEVAAIEVSFSDADEAMLVNHADRWDNLRGVMKIAAALSTRKEGPPWLSGKEQKAWRPLLIAELKRLLHEDIRFRASTNGPRRPRWVRG